MNAKRLLTPAFYLLLAVFLGIYLRGLDWNALMDLRVAPGCLFLAVPFSLAPRLLQPVAWGALIRGHGDIAPPYAQITLVYAKSWLGRYVPGKLAWIGGKVLFGTRYGVPANVLATTGIAEAGVQIVTALGLSLFLFGVARAPVPLGWEARAFAVLAFIVLSAALVPAVFRRLLSLAASVLRRPDWQMGRSTVRGLLGVAALYVGIHVLSAVPLFLLLSALHIPISLSDMPYLTAAFLLAGALGTLAVFAPSGLGVREGILLVLLAVLIPRSLAVVAVVFLRLWSIAMDALFYFVAAGLDRARPAARTSP